MDAQIDSVEVTVKSSELTYDAQGGFWWKFTADVGPGLLVKAHCAQSGRGTSVDTEYDSSIAGSIFSHLDDTDPHGIVLNMIAGLIPDREYIDRDVNALHQLQ